VNTLGESPPGDFAGALLGVGRPHVRGDFGRRDEMLQRLKCVGPPASCDHHVCEGVRPLAPALSIEDCADHEPSRRASGPKILEARRLIAHGSAVFADRGFHDNRGCFGGDEEVRSRIDPELSGVLGLPRLARQYPPMRRVGSPTAGRGIAT
jgi:hypothetical protein